MSDTVGSIYVKVFANTSGIKKQLERDGKDSGKTFGQSWDRAVAKEVNRGQFTDAVEREMRASARRTAKDWAAAQAKGLKNQKVKFTLDEKALDNLRDAAKRLGLDFEKELEGAAFNPKKIGAMVRDAMRAIETEKAKAQADAERKALKDRTDFERRWRADFNRTIKESEAIVRSVSASYERHGTKMTRVADSITAAARRAQRLIGDDYKAKVKIEVDDSRLSRFMLSMRKVDKYFRDMGRRGGIGMSALVAPIRAVTASFGVLSGAISLPLKGLSKFGDLADALGKRLMRTFGTKGGLLGNIFKPLSAGLSMAGSSMSKVMQSMAKSPWTAAAGAVVALTAGLKLLNVVLGAVVALVNAAAGVLTMLASAAYAAAANIVLLVPMMGALAVGFAGVAVGGMDAFKSVGLLAKAMNEADPKKRAAAFKEYEKSLKGLGKNAREAVRAFKPLLEEFQGLKKSAGEALFKGMADSLKAAKPMIAELKKGLEIAAGAVGGVINKFLQLGQDTQFVKDLGVMFKGVGVIIEDLGGAMVNVFAGLNSFFAAIQPIVEKFTGAIAKAAEGFRQWAQSEEGREKIKAWFTQAYEVGKKVWAIIKEVALAFHDLFTAGMNSETTTGLLDSILTKVQDFRKFIGEAAADGRLEEWFKQAKDTAKALWDAIVVIGSALQSLNTEENRAWLIGFIKGIGTAIKFLIDLSKFASNVFKVMSYAVAPFTAALGAGIGLIVKTVDWLARMSASNPFSKLTGAADSFKNAVKGAWEWVKNLISKLQAIKWPSIPGALKSLAGKFFAAGGITTGPSIAGEAGPEMVIPLTRPLSQIDPSVRQIAAMIRGQSTDRMSVPTGQTGPMKVVNNDIKVYAPSTDPAAVAEQIVNRSVAMAQ
jgi:hypothetical protein